MEHTSIRLEDEVGVFTDVQSDQDVSGEMNTEGTASSKTDQQPATTISGSWVSLLTLDYYQRLFDVSTRQVVTRTVAGMTPFLLVLVDTLGTNPDLYGPFWLAVTLVITNAVCGNLSKFWQVGSKWEFHFGEVTTLATVVLVYVWVMPVCVWALLWWRDNRNTYTLLLLHAIYGYSLATFIPLSILWTINNEALRWILLALGCALSSGVLGRSLWKPLSQDNRKTALIILGTLLLVHCGLTVGFKYLYFSSYGTSMPAPVTPSLTQPSPHPELTDRLVTKLLNNTV